jgi:TolA-binding protein
VQRDLRQLTAHYGRIGTPAINSLIHRLSSRQRSIAIGVAVTGAVLLIAGIAALMLSDRPGKRTGQEQTTAQQQQTAASTDTSTQAQISASPPQPQIAAPAQKNTTQPAPPDKPPAKQPEKQPAAAPNQTETDAPTASGTQPQPDNAPADTARAEQAPRLTTEPENQPETDTAPAEPKQDPQALRIAADFARASGLISRGEQEEAIPILRTIVTDHPKSPMAPEAQFALATAYRDSGDLEKAKLEFDRLLRTYPDSPRTAEALVGKVRAEWKTAPKIGLLRNAWDAELQKRLIQELAGALENLEETARVPALALVAEIAEAPELEDLPLAADMLVQQYALDPNPDADVIYRAGRIYDRKLDQVDKAVACYELFVKDFPQDPRMGRIKLRIKDLLDLPRN